MAEFPYLPLWTDALIGDTHFLTPAQFGAYLRLLIVAWRTKDCSLPDDDVFLGRAVGDPKNWHRLKPVVLPFFAKGDDGRFRQYRLLDERNYCSRMAARASAGGKAKALKRLHRASAKPVLNEFLMPAPIPTPIPKPISKKVSKKDIGKHLLPDNWEPLISHFKHGEKKGLSTEEVTDAALEMRSWSLGNGEKRDRWDHVFTNWLSRKAERKVKSNGNGHGRRNGPAQGKSAILETLDRAIEATRRDSVRAIEGPGDDGLFPEGRSERSGALSAGSGGNIIGFPKAGD